MNQLKISNEVLDIIEDMGWINDGIDPAGEGTFCANIYSFNSFASDHGILFNGTDEGLQQAVFLKQFEVIDRQYIKDMAGGDGMSYKDAKREAKQLYEDLAHLSNELGKAICRRLTTRP